MEVYFAVVILLIVLFLTYKRRTDVHEPLEMNLTTPKLYWFVDNERNARFNILGALTTMQPSRGYLSVALDRVKATQGKHFTIVPLIGRDAVMGLLPEAPKAATQLPPALWRQWTIANICASRGGLVMDGNSTLCVGPGFESVTNKYEAAMFGTYPDEPVVQPLTTVAPGASSYVGWASSPNHEGWMSAAHILNLLVARGPQSWSAALARREDMRIQNIMREHGVTFIRGVDGTRRKDGKPYVLEDWFGRVSVPEDPKLTLLPSTIYISYDGDSLVRRHELNWFVRLSPEQIAESDLVWSKLAGF